MKNYLFYTILTLAVFIFGCTNNEIPSDTTEIGIEQKNKLTILNDINEFKDFVVIEDTLNYAIWRDFPDSQSVAIGYFNDCTIIMESDSVRRPTHINCDNIIDISFLYKLDTTFVFYKYDEYLRNDTIFTSKSLSSRSTTGDILANISVWVIEKLAKKVLENMFKYPMEPLYKFLDYQKVTIDMNNQEILNYQIEQYKYLDWLLRPHIDNIPEGWLKRVIEKVQEENIGKIKEIPTIIIGLMTGETKHVYSESAICNIDGYLKAEANEGSFDFDYGICYSKTSEPTIKDFKVSKTISSGDFIDDITLALPISFKLTNLEKNTKYYYTAFFKDNITGASSVCEIVKSFTTGDDPISIEKIVVEKNIYDNESVTFDLNIYLKGSEEELKSVKQSGFYIKDKNNIIEYNRVPHFHYSTLPYTPISHKLIIPQDRFKKDYSKFKAEATGYYIGTYVQYDNGEYGHFDEKPIEGLVYDQKPSIGYNTVSVLGTTLIDSYTYEDGTVVNKYQTAYTYEAYVTGSFWISDVSSTCSGGYTFDDTGSQISSWGWKPNCDGKFNNKSGIKFWDNILEPCTVSLQLTLRNGSTLNADNSLFIAVHPVNTSISIIGSRNIQKNSNNKDLYQIDMHKESIQNIEGVPMRTPIIK